MTPPTSPSSQVIARLLGDLAALPGAPPGEHMSPEELVAFGSEMLSPVEAARVDAHLSACSVCGDAVERHLDTVRAWDGETGRARLTRLRQRMLPGLGRLVTPVTVTGARVGDTVVRAGVLPVLLQATALEHGDYVLPAGIHANVHLNMEKVCSSESVLRDIANAFAVQLETTGFDTVISTGWAMGTVARRLLGLRKESGACVRHVVAEGYDPPALLARLRPGARAVVLLDVVVTGQLATRLAKVADECGARIVRAVSLVEAAEREPNPYVEGLCRLPLGLHEPEECTWCGVLPRFEFDTITFRMMRKDDHPLSPQAFLEEDPQAREFWGLVDRARAYEHHRQEGRRHYLAFVDTTRLLGHPVTGPLLVEKLRAEVSRIAGVPDVLLVPGRARAVLLGRALANALGQGTTMLAAENRGNGCVLGPRARSAIAGRRVVVVDTAAGHGDTLDALVLEAQRAGATSVAAAILLSRLSPSCSRAFTARLGGTFTYLYSMPIRPIYSDDPRRCPMCRERDDLKAAAASSALHPIRELAEDAGRKGGRPGKPHYTQRQLLISGALLEGCRSGTASGIVLHALHAGRGGVMAPLSLAEIVDRRIPHQNRAAIIQHLPRGVIRARGGDTLVAELTRAVDAGVEEDVWLASVDVLSREGQAGWVNHLGRALEGARRPLAATTWRRLTYSAYRLGLRDSAVRRQLEGRLEELVETLGDTHAGSGLRGMLEAVQGDEEWC
jgi:orotate phosphoribosyltransferase